MERTKFWSRLGVWLRPAHRSMAVAGISPMATLEVSESAREVSVPPGDNRPNGNGSHGNGHGSNGGRPARKPSELQRIEDGYTRVVGLIESMQTHFQQQDQRTAVIASSLEKLAESLSQLPDASRGQFEVLSSMRDVLEHHAARAKRFEDSVAQLPQLADAQRETMAAISRQLDQSRQSSDRFGGALDSFQKAVVVLSEATAGSTAALRQMHNDSSTREERMVNMLEQQTRRFTFFACVAIGMSVIAAGAGLITAWIR